MDLKAEMVKILLLFESFNSFKCVQVLKSPTLMRIKIPSKLKTITQITINICLR